jgi:hypothetical protein
MDKLKAIRNILTNTIRDLNREGREVLNITTGFNSIEITYIFRGITNKLTISLDSVKSITTQNDH